MPQVPQEVLVARASILPEGSGAMPNGPAPHDLLWIATAPSPCEADAWHAAPSPWERGGWGGGEDGEGSLHSEAPIPDWATPQWLRQAPLVVRRDSDRDGCIPVGIRGLTRSQRHRAWLRPDAVQRRVSPEDLTRPEAWHVSRGLEAFPALQALAALRPMLERSGLPWGPIGGVGFALASGLPVLRADSDLDLLLRASQLRQLDGIARLLANAGNLGCRIDVQVDTGSGGFALAEWLRGGQVLLKTDVGPGLTDDPWRAIPDGAETSPP